MTLRFDPEPYHRKPSLPSRVAWSVSYVVLLLGIATFDVWASR